MKQRFFSKSIAFACICFAVLHSACTDRQACQFKTPEEAVSACRERLAELQAVKTADIKELTDIISDWTVLQDSAYERIINDSTIETTGLMTDMFFDLADSIRDEITRIAFSLPRTLYDVTYLKLYVATDRQNRQKSATYKKALGFYESLDDVKCYPSAKKTLEAYHRLLDETKPFVTEGDLLDFIGKEDRCFRSLLLYLMEIPQKELQDVTDLTSSHLDKITSAVSAKTGDEQSERVRTYLMMRFNRRIMQNAMVCRADIRRKVTLDETQSANYRWMIIQPFFAIDNNSMQLITPKQEKQLKDLAGELPLLIAYIDGNGTEEGSSEDIEQMSNVLVEYFLKSYLRLTL